MSSTEISVPSRRSQSRTTRPSLEMLAVRVKTRELVVGDPCETLKPKKKNEHQNEHQSVTLVTVCESVLGLVRKKFFLKETCFGGFEKGKENENREGEGELVREREKG